MISKNQVDGLPEAMNELDRLSNIETEALSDAEIDSVFENNEPNIEEGEQNGN